MSAGDRLTDQLTEAGILEESAADLSLTDSFLEATRDERAHVERVGVATVLDDLAAELSDGLYHIVSSEIGATGAYLGTYRAIDRHGTDMTPDEVMLGTALLEVIRDDSIRGDGAPDTFLPVSLDALLVFLSASERAMVYAWREDCSPCDGLAESLDELFADGSSGISLYALYGPDHAAALRERYDVAVAPTLLFMLGGVVDSRLIGDKPMETLRAERDALLRTDPAVRQRPVE